MGMFDEIQFKMPLPVELGCDHRDHWFQTKSLDCACDYYEIREDGTLWHQEYQIEDRSDPNAKGFARLVGSIERINNLWVQVFDFTGEIRFYTSLVMINGESKTVWIEFSTYFVRGELKHIEPIAIELTSKT